MEVAWTLFSAILGLGFPLHTPYPYSLYHGEDEPSILGTNEMFGEKTCFGFFTPILGDMIQVDES